jgi:hypothetical protein
MHICGSSGQRLGPQSLELLGKHQLHGAREAKTYLQLSSKCNQKDVIK